MRFLQKKILKNTNALKTSKILKKPPKTMKILQQNHQKIEIHKSQQKKLSSKLCLINRPAKSQASACLIFCWKNCQAESASCVAFAGKNMRLFFQAKSQAIFAWFSALYFGLNLKIIYFFWLICRQLINRVKNKHLNWTEMAFL